MSELVCLKLKDLLPKAKDPLSNGDGDLKDLENEDPKKFRLS